MRCLLVTSQDGQIHILKKSHVYLKCHSNTHPEKVTHIYFKWSLVMSLDPQIYILKRSHVPYTVFEMVADNVSG